MWRTGFCFVRADERTGRSIRRDQSPQAVEARSEVRFEDEDADLSPLLQLSHLSEIRMRDRREYRPRLAEVKKHLGSA